MDALGPWLLASSHAPCRLAFGLWQPESFLAFENWIAHCSPHRQERQPCMTLTNHAASKPTEMDLALAEERRRNGLGARVFEAACRTGDVEAFLSAVDCINQDTVDGWRLAMLRVSRLPEVSQEIRSAFLNVWVEMNVLPLRVGDRRTLANALKILMPPVGPRAPMILYRGASWWERTRRRYGFSWTSRLDIARCFGEHWKQIPHGGVILRTVAPPEAILLVREDVGDYDEGEVVVDPFALGRIEVEERLNASVGALPAFRLNIAS
jgi:hypothetical protein